MSLLPPQSKDVAGKPTLVLDLDNTLIHEEVSRPGLDKFLEAMKDLYEIVIFTAGTRDSAEPIIDSLNEKHGNCISHRLYGESCIGYIVKPLAQLGRDLSRVVVIDDKPETYAQNVKNAIAIKFFHRSNLETDNALSELVPLLTSVATAKDVRVAIQTAAEQAKKASAPVVQVKNAKNKNTRKK